LEIYRLSPFGLNVRKADFCVLQNGIILFVVFQKFWNFESFHAGISFISQFGDVFFAGVQAGSANLFSIALNNPPKFLYFNLFSKI